MGGIKGIPQMRTKLRRIVQQYPYTVGAALYKEAQIELTESKRRCPVAPDGGTLRASGQVHPPEREGLNNITVMISYGGAASDYAIAVHEHMSEHSPPSWIAAENGGFGVHWNAGGTGPKYLESVLNESRAHMAQRVGRRIML